MFSQGWTREIGNRVITVEHVPAGPIDTDLILRRRLHARKAVTRSTGWGASMKSPRWCLSSPVRSPRTSPGRILPSTAE